MSDLGRQIRNLVDRSAPPISGRDIIRSASAPRRRNWIPGVAAAVAVLVVGAFSFVFGVWQPGDVASDTFEAIETSPSTALSTTTVTTEAPTTSVVDVVTEPKPIRVDCTGELESFPCAALLDDDLTTSWQITQGIIGAELTFWFARPVALEAIGFQNLTDDTRFARNARIRGMEIMTDDLSETTIAELPDSNDVAHFVDVSTIQTSSVTITITSAYPGASVGELEPFTELALAEVTFHGRFVESEYIPPANTALISESLMVFGGLDVVVCDGADPSVRTGRGDGTLYTEPRAALVSWIEEFNGGLGGSPPIPEMAYTEMVWAGGLEGYTYGIPLGRVAAGVLSEIPLANATFGVADEQGEPTIGLDSRFVVELRVVPAGDAWTIDYWQVSGC